MPNGYTRQDTTGALANGQPIDADLFNNEYNAIESAMHASTGHNHDGTTGGGATINKIGPSNELEADSSAVFPKVNNLIDNGKTTLRWKDGYYAGTVYADDVSVTDDLTVGDDLTVTGDVQFGNLTDGTITIDSFVDEDNMSSDSATKVPTQQSVKAYVDSKTNNASGTVTTGNVDLGGGSGSGWVIYQSGTDLKFKYNGVDRFKLTSAGALTVEDNVSAFGSA